MSTYDFLPKCNEYWLDEQYESLTAKQMKKMLVKRGRDVRGLNDSWRLRRALMRSDHNLPSFMCYTDAQLQDLIRARDDPRDVGGHRTNVPRPVLIAMLERLDGARDFWKFLDLPPELRCRIYGYYFAEFEERALHAPKRPPLTLTCRVVRKEALPLFYATCKFALNFVQYDNEAEFLFPIETSMWMLNTTAPNMASLRRISLRGWVRIASGARAGSVPRLGICIDIVIEKDGAISFEVHDPESVFGARARNFVRHRLFDKVRLMQIMNGYVSDGKVEGLGFVIADFFKMRREMEHVLAIMLP